MDCPLARVTMLIQLVPVVILPGLWLIETLTEWRRASVAEEGGLSSGRITLSLDYERGEGRYQGVDHSTVRTLTAHRSTKGFVDSSFLINIHRLHRRAPIRWVSPPRTIRNVCHHTGFYQTAHPWRATLHRTARAFPPRIEVGVKWVRHGPAVPRARSTIFCCHDHNSH